MAMGTCRECGKEVSTTAKTCPHCGVARPIETDPKAVAIGCGLTLVLVGIFYWGMCSGPSTTPGYVSDPSPSPSVMGCDGAAAAVLLKGMRGPMVASVADDAGWTVVTFGQDYFSWTAQQTEGVVTTYANADACVTKRARNLEFRSPSGKLIARADGTRGIQMK